MFNRISFFLIAAFLFWGGQSLLGQGNTTEITGKVVEANSQSPIGYATVAVYDAGGEKVLGGTTTQEDGTFKTRVKPG